MDGVKQHMIDIKSLLAPGTAQYTEMRAVLAVLERLFEAELYRTHMRLTLIEIPGLEPGVLDEVHESRRAKLAVHECLHLQDAVSLEK